MSKETILKSIAIKAKATGVLGAALEELQALWAESSTDVRSSYGIYGNPPMWEILRFENGLSLYTRPARIQGRATTPEPIKMVDGVSYQFLKDGEWRGQAYIATFEDFESNGAATHEISHLLAVIAD